MSLFASLTTAITGLNAQQDAIGNISDNISNAQTVGFKGIGTTFQNLVTDSTPELNQPGGVTATPLYENNVAGNLTPSEVTTNLAISGQGFFQVKAPPAAVPTGQQPIFSQQNLYTQAGDFTLNAQGFLVNSAGYYLTAYQVTNPQTKTVNTSTTVPIQVSQLVDAPEATANLNLAANMPSSYPLSTIPGPPPAANPAYTAPSPITEQVYDATGAAQTETIQLNHTAANTWTATISDGSTTSTDEPAVLQFNFSNGTTAGFPAGTLQSITNITPNPTAPATLPVVVPAQGVTTTPTSGQAATFSIVQDFGAGAQTLNFNIGNYGTASGVTQYADSTVTVQSLTQDGIPRGSFENLSIDQNGFVNLNYTNGQSLSFFQIPVVQFNAPDQLQRLQGSAFSSTLGSGAPEVNPPGVDGGGTIAPSTLEQSNVDIATQFTNLITAQQVYSANSKVITTADQLLSTVIGLIQS